MSGDGIRAGGLKPKGAYTAAWQVEAAWSYCDINGLTLGRVVHGGVRAQQEAAVLAAEILRLPPAEKIDNFSPDMAWKVGYSGVGGQERWRSHQRDIMEAGGMVSDAQKIAPVYFEQAAAQISNGLSLVAAQMQGEQTAALLFASEYFGEAALTMGRAANPAKALWGWSAHSLLVCHMHGPMIEEVRTIDVASWATGV